MRRVLFLSLFWIFALGLSACDSSRSNVRRVLAADDAGEPDDQKPESAHTAGKSGSNARSGTAGASGKSAPGKSAPGDSGAADFDAGTSRVICGGFAGFTC